MLFFHSFSCFSINQNHLFFFPKKISHFDAFIFSMDAMLPWIMLMIIIIMMVMMASMKTVFKRRSQWSKNMDRKVWSKLVVGFRLGFRLGNKFLPVLLRLWRRIKSLYFAVIYHLAVLPSIHPPTNQPNIYPSIPPLPSSPSTIYPQMLDFGFLIAHQMCITWITATIFLIFFWPVPDHPYWPIHFGSILF